jgi:hypothetical protein
LGLPNDAKDLLSETLRICNEIRDNIQNYQDPLENNIEKHAVDFLRGKIDKNDLKKLVQRNYKSSKKTQFANMHRSMYVDAVRNTLVFVVNELYRPQKDQETIDTILQNTFTVLNNLRDYTEKNLENLGNLFNSEKPRLTNYTRTDELNTKRYVTKFLKTLHKIRTERFYMDWTTRNVFYHLIKINGSPVRAGSEHDIINFLRSNPNWVPKEEEIIKAKEESEGINRG